MEKQKLKERKSKTQKGITLIALIITIVVLLILAVVTIRAVQGDGIIKHAKDAKEQYSVAEEKEKLYLAVNESFMSGKGVIEETSLTNALNSKFGDNNWQYSEKAEEYFKVKISASEREYKIYKNGKVEEEKSGKYYVVGKQGDSELVIYYLSDDKLKGYNLYNEEFHLAGEETIKYKSNPDELTITVDETPVKITTSDTAIELDNEIIGYIKGDLFYIEVANGDSISSTSDHIAKLDSNFSFEKYLPITPENFYKVKYSLKQEISGQEQELYKWYFYENGKFIFNNSSYYIGTYTVNDNLIDLDSDAFEFSIKVKNKSSLYMTDGNDEGKLTRSEEEFTYQPELDTTNGLFINAIYKTTDGYYLYTFNGRVTASDPMEIVGTVCEDISEVNNYMTISEGGKSISGLNIGTITEEKEFTLVENLADI